MSIGKKIKGLRRQNDMTQEQLADLLGVSYQAVSKWETDISCPDLSLIVPIAKLFKVTTDELLDMASPEIDEKKREYDALYEKAHHPEQLELAEKASKEYPGELKYIDWQASCLYMLAFDNHSKQDKFYSDLEKALKLYYVVFQNTDDEKLKSVAIAGIVMTLAALHRNDEAEEYAKLYPDASNLDKDTVLGWALNGEKKEKHNQKMLIKHFDEMLEILIHKNYLDDKNPRCIETLMLAQKMIEMMFPSGNYNRYYEEMMLISIYKARLYEYTEPQTAVSELKKARYYAERFDELFMKEPVAVRYESPFFDLLEFNSNDLLVYGPLEENKRIDTFEWWISGKMFDGLRNYIKTE